MGHKLAQHSTLHDIFRKIIRKTLVWQRCVFVILLAIATALLIILANPLSKAVNPTPPPLQP
ncbi:MAG: hypothetical protein SAL70_43265, partial [Scytonema sp. PMC 1070.18]|nr:hypothetical protein [Scytonema sp. PMC 1070.18]